MMVIGKEPNRIISLPEPLCLLLLLLHYYQQLLVNEWREQGQRIRYDEIKSKVSLLTTPINGIIALIEHITKQIRFIHYNTYEGIRENKNC